MDSKASDILDPKALVQAQFTLSVRNGVGTIEASMTFEGNGLQLLPKGAQLRVNDVNLAPHKLQKQGYWYKASVKRTPRYVLQYSLDARAPGTTHEFADRVFEPRMPTELRRSQGVTIPYSGPPMGPGEELFVHLAGPEGPAKWGVVVEAVHGPQQILIPASALAEARLGSAQLYVGMTRMDSISSDKLYVVHAVGTASSVMVLD